MEYLPFMSQCLGQLDRLIFALDSIQEIVHIGRELSDCFKEFANHELHLIELGISDDSLLEDWNVKVQERLTEIVNNLRHLILVNGSENNKTEFEKVISLLVLQKTILGHKFEVDLYLKEARYRFEIAAICAEAESKSLSFKCESSLESYDVVEKAFYQEYPSIVLEEDKERFNLLDQMEASEKSNVQEIQSSNNSQIESELVYLREREKKSKVIKSDLFQPLDFAPDVRAHQENLQKMKTIQMCKMATSKFWQIWANQHLKGRSKMAMELEETEVLGYDLKEEFVKSFSNIDEINGISKACVFTRPPDH